MSKINLARTIEILANVGVIAGIVFLAVEVRQNNELLAAEARFNRVAVAAESMTIVAENPDLAGYLVRANDNQELAPDEALRLQMYMRRTLTNMEWTFREIPEAGRPVATWRRIFAEPYRRRTWEALKEEYDPAFVEFVDMRVLNR